MYWDEPPPCDPVTVVVPPSALKRAVAVGALDGRGLWQVDGRPQGDVLPLLAAAWSDFACRYRQVYERYPLRADDPTLSEEERVARMVPYRMVHSVDAATGLHLSVARPGHRPSPRFVAHERDRVYFLVDETPGLPDVVVALVGMEPARPVPGDDLDAPPWKVAWMWAPNRDGVPRDEVRGLGAVTGLLRWVRERHAPLVYDEWSRDGARLLCRADPGWLERERARKRAKGER